MPAGAPRFTPWGERGPLLWLGVPAEPLRFCIHSVSARQRALLEAHDPPVKAQDCLGICSDCFVTPTVMEGERVLDKDEVATLLTQSARDEQRDT